MGRKMKIEVVRRLIARGEELCARVCCADWHLSFKKIAGTV